MIDRRQVRARSELRTRQGDDHAARLKVVFDLPPQRPFLADTLRMRAARLLSDTEIPAAAICDVAGHAQPVGNSAWHPCIDHVRLAEVR